jgi:transposase
MYLRHSTRRKGGKSHTYWRLVRSVRRGNTVIQETVAHLGELDAAGRAKGKALARQMTGRGDQRELFEATSETSSARLEVRLDQVRVERQRAFGGVWLGWTLWRALGLDELCKELLVSGRESVPWSVTAAVLVLARLCEPSSELHIAEAWYRKTALEDLLGVPAEKVYENRLYRALDRLLPHKAAIERHLKTRLGELFALDYDLLLYDVTSTYFEGMANGTPLAQRGYSRDHRPDCKQVNIALVVTHGGMPLGYEVFAGNRTDVTTVEEIVEAMEARYGRAERIWVMDRGMMSQENIAWLNETERRYLIGTPRVEMKKWERELAAEDDWHKVRDGIEVKICPGPDGEETFLLCRSADRQEKERAMHERFAARIETGLESLGRRLERARRPLDRGTLERQIGRLLERNRRAAGRYQIRLVDDDRLPSTLRLRWSVHKQWDQWARQSEGSYVLRTNVRDWTPEAMWKTYIQLWEVEAAFRLHKSELSIRPIWHQKEERVLAHILVCFLAYVLWKTLEQWQSRAGLGNSPRTILEEIGRIHSADVVLPLGDHTRREVRIRCVIRPDRAQALLLDRLGLRLPERLKLRGPIAQM